jgi:integrase
MLPDTCHAAKAAECAQGDNCAVTASTARQPKIGNHSGTLTKAGRGAVTVRRALATLRMVFSAAVRDEIIPANPALMVDKPTVTTAGEKHWEPEHVATFIERCGHRRLGPLFELAVYTGLRRGEICGLHWSDVDLTARQIVVRHNRVTVDGHVQELTTRTRSGRRSVPLSDAAVAALLTWKLQQAGEAEAAKEAWQTQGHGVHHGGRAGAGPAVHHPGVPEDQAAG